MAQLPKMHSYWNKGLMISLEAPEGWDVISSDESPLGLFAPEESDYRAHLSFKIEKSDPQTPEMFEQFVREVYHSGNLKLGQFSLVEDYNFELDERPAYAARYEWVAEQVGAHFSQLDVWVLAAEDAIYRVSGYSLKGLEEKYMPIFEHVIGSIRFIPPRSSD